MKNIKNSNVSLYQIFSNIPLDIDGSNIGFVGHIPSDEFKQYMSEKDYETEKKRVEKLNENVIFKNVKLQFGSCECGIEYPCDCDPFVYAIEINNEDNIHELTLDEGFINFHNKIKYKYAALPIQNATIFDFIRMCQLCEIDLEFSDYALSLFKY